VSSPCIACCNCLIKPSACEESLRAHNTLVIGLQSHWGHRCQGPIAVGIHSSEFFAPALVTQGLQHSSTHLLWNADDPCTSLRTRVQHDIAPHVPDDAIKRAPLLYWIGIQATLKVHLQKG
jgi:hypothetical protein